VPQIVTCGRIVLATMAICCLLYTLVILGVGQAITPHTANGSLIQNENGVIVGSEVMAQKFERSEYFWPRPSAVDYNASATGGSNLSPTNPKLRIRAEEILTRLGRTDERPVPADLVTASGSGMDPNITLQAAEFQAQRVAATRGLPLATLMGLLNKHAEKPGGFLTEEPLLNVLLLNIALDSLSR